jgi:hypothetical protein
MSAPAGRGHTVFVQKAAPSSSTVVHLYFPPIMPVHQPSDVYLKQLTSQYNGIALWNPKPIKGLYDHVSIGDVGYLSYGDFVRMFNVKLPWDDPSNTRFKPPKEFKSLDEDHFTNVRGSVTYQAEYHPPSVSKVDYAGNVQAGTADQ